MTLHFDVQKDFSNNFGGSTRKDSDFSAEHLREDYLVPMIKKLKGDEQIVVNLGNDSDEDCHYAANFLQEGFAGLIKYNHISHDDFVRIFKFTYDDEDFAFYKERIYKYAMVAALTLK